MSGKSPRGHSKLRAAAGVFATRQDPSWLYLEFVKRTHVEKNIYLCCWDFFTYYRCCFCVVRLPNGCSAFPLYGADSNPEIRWRQLYGKLFYCMPILFTYTDIIYMYIYNIYFINNANLLSPSRSGQQGELRTSSKPSTPKATGKVVAWHEFEVADKENLKWNFQRSSLCIFLSVKIKTQHFKIENGFVNAIFLTATGNPSPQLGLNPQSPLSKLRPVEAYEEITRSLIISREGSVHAEHRLSTN